MSLYVLMKLQLLGLYKLEMLYTWYYSCKNLAASKH